MTVENFALMIFMVFVLLLVVFAFGFAFGVKVSADKRVATTSEVEGEHEPSAAVINSGSRGSKGVTNGGGSSNPGKPNAALMLPDGGLPKTTVAAARQSHYARLATERESQSGKGRK